MVHGIVRQIFLQFSGVCLSHANLISHIVAFTVCTSDDVLFCVSSLRWVSGYWILLLDTFCGAARVITTETPSAEMQIRLIEKYKVTIVLGLSYGLVALLKTGLVTKSGMSSIRHFIMGGKRVSPSIAKQFESFLVNGKVNIAYGTTEMGILTIDFIGVESVGQMISRYDVKIIDEDGIWRGINADGEICVKSSYKFLGYYGCHELSQVVDDEGFFLTEFHNSFT